MVDFWGRVLQNNPNVIDKASSDHVIGNNTLTFKSSSSVAAANGHANGGHAKNTTKPANLFRSVLNSSNVFFSGLHTKLNAALSLDERINPGDEDSCESDSLYDGYMKKKQRDSGGEFGESSTTSPSWDTGFTGMTSATPATDKISSRYPKRWMDPTVMITKHQRHKSKTNGCTVRSTTTTAEVSTCNPDVEEPGNKHRLRKARNKSKKSTTTSTTCNALDSDPAISSNESAGSESENPTTDTVTRDTVDSSSLGHSTSEASLLSWSSNVSHDSQNDEGNHEIADYMRHFVDKLLNNNVGISQEEKAHFGELCQTETGRLWFARCINAQRMNKKVGESTFYSLIQYFAIVIFECSEADDYAPAKSLMNMCFTFYHEVAVPGCKPYKEFLYLHLKEQPIWQSLRFWNAAFFDAVQCERAHRPVATRKDLEHYSPDDISDEKELQENITFGQLGSFTCNMHAFGLSKELCLEFLRKQSTIADLKPGQIASIRENIEKMFSETEPWRS